MSLSRRQFHQMLLATSAASVLLPEVARPASDQPVFGGTLNWVFFPEPSAIIAINTSSGTGQTIGTKINEGLFTYDYDLNPKPVLATNWTISPDGLTYTFRLRANVKWHDGKPFTSDDVAFSILRLREAHPRGRATFANVVRVETPDPLTAILILSKPAPFLITALSGAESPIVPKHIYETFKPSEQPKLEQTIGTGPFILKEWVPGSHLLFIKNPNYWDAPKPYVDRLVMRIITDPSARAAALETGQVDIGANPVPLADLERLKANPQLVVDTTTYAYSGPQQQLFFNLETKVFQDRRVRLAVAHALDLKVLLDVVYLGYGSVSPSPVSVVLPKFYNPKIEAWPFDPALSERLLDEAGLTRGEGGIRLKARLTVNPFHLPAFGDFVKQALRRIGIDADLQRYDLATYLTKVYKDRNFDLVIESLSNVFDPTLGVQRAYWSKNFQLGLPFSNAAHYDNPEVDRLLEAAAVERDEAKRRDLWFRFQEIIHEEVASVDLVAPAGIIVAAKKVRNFAPGAEGLNGSFADLWIAPDA
ncbi:ABC transporter substrate-binding protein [Chelatococcus asaccharovorans]|uniref:Peptide/nickel transport system substrate-binding protein n=1 Tax=Chelatococcus asaccharovorans TaxID=28210 RepID=A0A2V3U4T6_9HYPH|nr:ABC transporter substrate-binding protein [Chelatococcus asaccharovorans]MBS7703769.1 ABC transporter substrate-binding protein [Chelatococcus asaccharovorans]PXW57929.1 peptide/nickel transport system substrate-binding protein [Chelatococcus asaccharovorans]